MMQQNNNLTTEDSLLLSLLSLTTLYTLSYAPTIFYKCILRISAFFHCIWNLSGQSSFSPLGILSSASDVSCFILDIFLSYNLPIFTQILLIHFGTNILYIIMMILEKEGVLRRVTIYSIWYQIVTVRTYYIITHLNSGMHEVLE